MTNSPSNLGLDDLDNLSNFLEAPTTTNTAGPLELRLDLLDEDPNQPRSEFDPISLKELADTIRLRGVKTPISVHQNPNKKGRFIINHGARRYRATKLAGKKTIPVYIDNDYTQADQVIENIQRDNLSAREIADYIGRELSKGTKKVDIATLIGKSKAFITQHATLLDLPPIIAKLFNTERVRDVTVINELVNAYKSHPNEIAIWLENEKQEITRSTIKVMRECLLELKNKRQESITPKKEINDSPPSPKDDLVIIPAVQQDAKVTSPKSLNIMETKLDELLDECYKNIKSQKDSTRLLNQLSNTERKTFEALLQKLIRLANSHNQSK
jgi:ParB family transcriptional regulator, chromosome partitioning protein